jgi:hypothetical protein
VKLSNIQAFQLYLIAVDSLNHPGPMGVYLDARQKLVDEIINQQDTALVDLRELAGQPPEEPE